MNRQYAAVPGKFMRADPVAGNPGNPQNWNRYSYTMNDPVNLVDPEGLMIGFPILTGLLSWPTFSETVQVNATYEPR